MKLITYTAIATLAASAAFSAGTGDHSHGHSHKNHMEGDHKTVDSAGQHGHTEGHKHGDHAAMMAIGMPGMMGDVTRTIDVTMRETDDGAMIFEPAAFDIKQGETIRFHITNMGELEHEFVLDTKDGNARHKEMMAQMEMAHDDPNSIQLAPGESGEIVWTFSNPGAFEYACLIPGHYESGMHGPIQVAETAVERTYTKGVVKKVKADKGQVTIIHEELVELDMPAMTMVFFVADDSMLDGLSEGQEIAFAAERVKGKLTVVDLK